MSPQTAVVLSFLSVLLGLVVWFRLKEKLLKQQHQDHISVLENAISTNLGQQNIRNEGLGRYDFMKYNLDESLVIQPEIILRT